VRKLSYKETIELLKHNKNITLAILDINLPDSTQGEIVDLVTQKNIPSIVITGFENKELKESLLHKKIINYIYKDHDGINQLVNSIRLHLKSFRTNILLVDDSRTQLEATKHILKNMNFNVFTAKDGLEALRVLNSHIDFNLVITDYNMPCMDGLELVSKIREKYQKDKLGILVLSASDKPELSEIFIKIGANDFINKPYNPIEFQVRVNSNLEILYLFDRTRDLANEDFLTGLHNRRFFFESANAIFSKAQRDKKDICIAMFDIDKFKNINDTYGHDIGDIAIKEVAHILSSHLRESDLIARFGGEEFCVLLQDISKDDVIKLFTKIRKVFEDNIIQIDDLSISYTVSIGLCYGLEKTLEDMIKVADNGLYYCKNNGRNQIAFG
jgi:diguanylate cyclase (GGDEF)-like protein